MKCQSFFVFFYSIGEVSEKSGDEQSTDDDDDDNDVYDIEASASTSTQDSHNRISDSYKQAAIAYFFLLLIVKKYVLPYKFFFKFLNSIGFLLQRKKENSQQSGANLDSSTMRQIYIDGKSNYQLVGVNLIFSIE